MPEPLITGYPLGNIQAQEEVYLDGSPYIYFQDASAPLLNNPDASGFYWNLSGTAAYPVMRVGCNSNVSLTEGLTINQIRCDTVGDKGTIQRRDYIELAFEFSSLLPLSIAAELLKLGSTVTSGSGFEKVGIGQINNNKYFHAYLPKVYDTVAGDYVSITLHRAQFVDAFTIGMASGEPWMVSGMKLRAYADETKPPAQMFGTIIRYDPSAIP
jgi:hypothetical protein